MKTEMQEFSVKKSLSKDDLHKLFGGAGPPDCIAPEVQYQCECKAPAIGAWIGCYATQGEADADILVWCSNQLGTCFTNPPH